ncbi:MAG: sulfite exporter TauE/SafE family protein [Bryobacterales bacterium]|nr:sulfite exporter TauE/SafE family protein [Bryobacterales bacterium]
MEVVVGFIIALIVGMTGMGGGPLAVPILTLWLGLPAAAAVGTSFLFVTITKLVATPIYLSRGQVDLRMVRHLAIGGIPGVITGSLLLSRMKSEALQPAVLTVVGLLIVVMAGISMWKLFSPELDRPAQARLAWVPVLTFLIGLEVGFSSAGAGALCSLVLMYFTTLPMNRIVGTDLLFGLVLSTIGGGLHLAVGTVETGLLVKLCIGGVLGAAVGAQVGSRMPIRPLRAALSTVLVYLGGSLFWKGFQVLVK